MVTHRWSRAVGALACLALILQISLADNEGYNVPVAYQKLSNGLKVILSPDHTAPTVVVAVYYNIGFRIEPKNRTGFAHLFEHMMFQGIGEFGEDGIHPARATQRWYSERINSIRFHKLL